MNRETSNVNFLNALDRVANVRQTLAEHLTAIAQTFQQAELTGATASGQFGLAWDIETLKIASEHYRQGIFRLLVLGDMKRGKSTLLNALLGQNLLPSDVNPCTALLTVIRYGPHEKVTLHYKDERPATEISFETFKQQYTIQPDEAKALEQEHRHAFPDISHAVVEHPLPLLGKGIELIDSPGLNDTEARNELSLNYIYNCHAVLFVLSASQPCTLDERRYLQNYLSDQGLSIFFLINGWDRVRTGLVDPDDPNALQEAETRLRQIFQSHLAKYCWSAAGQDRYKQRVFEISALEALRSRLRDPEAPLEDTGFSAFLKALKIFLVQDRATAECNRITAIANRAYQHVKSAIERRIPLLEQSAAELQQTIDTVQADFDQLAAIGQQFQNLIEQTGEQEAKAIADSFQHYILELETTFEQDFIRSQPDLDFLRFLEKNNRAAFYTTFKRAFERYLNDRLAAWEFIARQKISAAFEQLNQEADHYRVSYEEVVEAINKKLVGTRFYAVEHNYDPNRTTVWTDALQDLFSTIPDVMNGVPRQFNVFWQQVFIGAFPYLLVVIGLNVLGLIFSSLFLNVLALIAAGAGVLAIQAEYIRQEFLAATQREFAKHLPQIATENWRSIYSSVQSCFDAYRKQVGDRIQADIESRRAELANLLQQKQSHEIDRELEVQRLQTLETTVLSHLQAMEALKSLL
jgi:GTPase SAR1 family protein